jgi:hypothetical protein
MFLSVIIFLYDIILSNTYLILMHSYIYIYIFIYIYLSFIRQVSHRWELYSDEDRDKPSITAFVYILETTIDSSTKYAIISRNSITDNYNRFFTSRDTDNYQKRLVAEDKIFQLKYYFLQTQIFTHEELIKMQCFYCALMSAVLAGKHREKV